MSPIDWAKRPLQKYADFSGRAARAEYWWFVLAIIVCYVIINIIESLIGINRMVLGIYGPLMVLLWLATLVPQIAVSVRRLHDTNRTGWWWWIGWVPFFGWIVLLVFYLLRGTPGPNRYSVAG